MNLMIRSMAEHESRGIKGIFYYFFPTYAQGRKALWDAIDKEGFAFRDHFPKDFVQKINDSEMQVITKNGSIFQIIGTDDINSIMGTNPLACVFSEYSLQDSKAWKFIRPILAENEGWAVFNFTPRGRNHAWELLRKAAGDPTWFSQTLTVEDTGAISEKSLEQERAEMPPDLFEQEYFCVFSDGAGQFFKNIEDCVWSGDLEVREDGRYQAGIDLAQVRDFTVLTTIDLNTFRVGKQTRFNQLDYTDQKELIKGFYEKWNKPRTYIDQTGVGLPVYNDLVNVGLRNLQGFTFTEQSKKELLINLKLKLEQRIILIPNDENLINELKAFRYELDEKGQTKIVGVSGITSDMVMSLALAVWELPNKPLPLPKEVKDEFEDLKKFDRYRGMKPNQLRGAIRAMSARVKWLENKKAKWKKQQNQGL